MLVVCNGMLRSGSTLQYNFTRTLLELTSSGAGAGYAEPTAIEDEQLASWTASDTMTVIKMHNIDPRVISLLMDNKAIVSYIYRDLRHVAASIRRKWNPSWPDMLTRLDGAVASFETLTNTPRVLVQRYESVLANEVKSVQEISDHLGLEATQEDLAEVVRLCSPAALRESATGLTARQKFYHSVNAVGRRLPPPMRPTLRRVAFGSVGRKLGFSQVYDQKTLLHPDHITSGASTVEDEFRDFTEAEITELSTRYAAFFHHANYKV